jgi:hypothetical protein
MTGGSETSATLSHNVFAAARSTLDAVVVLEGLSHFLLRGRNSDAAFHSLLRLHCTTNGRSTQLVTDLLRRAQRQAPLALRHQSHFSAISAATQAHIAEEIHEQGYSILPVRLSPAACDELITFSKRTPAEAIDERAQVLGMTTFNGDDARVVRFKYRPDDLVKSEVVQSLLADPVLLSIARLHFGSAPLVDSVAMWWSLAKGAAPSSDLAQLYHFDFDRPKWLKLFFYLTDVDDAAGPHTFVRGSHRREERRAHLLRRGYVRIPDDEIEAIYSKSAVVPITGQRGTVFFEDTSGFHKGKAPITGNRLLFEIQFCLSRFGAHYPPVTLPPQPTAAFESFVRDHRGLYPMFNFGLPTS